MKMLVVFHVIILAILLFCGPSGAAQRYSKDDVLVVLSKSGLEIREKADVRARVLGIAPCGALVTMEGDPAGSLLTVGGIEGRWARVTCRDVTGYAFDGFLSRLRAPEEGCESLEEYYSDQFKSAGSPVEKTDASEGAGEKTTELMFSNGATIIHTRVISRDGGPERSLSIYTLPGIERVEEVYLLLRLLGYIDPELAFPSKNGNAGFARDGSACEAVIDGKNNGVLSLEMKFRKPDLSGKKSSDIDASRIIIRREGEGITVKLHNMKR